MQKKKNSCSTRPRRPRRAARSPPVPLPCRCCGDRTRFCFWKWDLHRYSLTHTSTLCHWNRTFIGTWTSAPCWKSHHWNWYMIVGISSRIICIARITCSTSLFLPVDTNTTHSSGIPRHSRQLVQRLFCHTTLLMLNGRFLTITASDNLVKMASFVWIRKHHDHHSAMTPTLDLARHSHHDCANLRRPPLNRFPFQRSKLVFPSWLA